MAALPGRAAAARAPTLVALLLLGAVLVPCRAGQLRRRSHRYLLGTFPNVPGVSYTTLPPPKQGGWEPLVVGGLQKPEALAVDPRGSRFYVADLAARTVVAFPFIVLSNGQLITDGHQRVIMERVGARGLFVDSFGTLFIAGSQDPDPATLAPGAIVEPLEGVFKLEAAAVTYTLKSFVLVAPTVLWTRSNTAPITAQNSPQLFSPSCLKGDSVSLFWGNGAKPDGSVSGSVVAADAIVPAVQPETHVRPLGDNLDSVIALAVTPSSVFYAGQGKVYGVPKQKVGMTCGDNSTLCPAVLLQGSTELRPTAMEWDGDGTIFIADPTLGGVFSFASGTLSQHVLTKAVDASGIWGLAYFVPTSAAAAQRRSRVAELLAVVVSIAVASFAADRR